MKSDTKSKELESNFISFSIVAILVTPQVFDFVLFGQGAARISRVLLSLIIASLIWAKRSSIFSNRFGGDSVLFVTLLLYVVGTFSAINNSGVITPNVIILLIFITLGLGSPTNIRQLRRGLAISVHILCILSVLAILLKLNPRNLYLSDLGYPVIFDNIGIPGRNYGVMSHPNGLGQVAALSYIFSVYRYGNKFLIAPAVFCLLKCGSRTAISACVLVSLVIALHKFWPKRVVAQRKKKFSEVFNTVSVVIGVSLTTLFLINLNGLSPDALTGRAQIWQTAKELFNSKLIFGLGWGWEGRAIEANLLNVWAVSAHNAILEVLFSTGFAGLILFLYLITICISGVRNFEPLDKSLLLTLMVFGISESILDIQYPSVTTFIFFLLTLSNRQGRQDEK